jgi:sucrose-6-phosphate hydrolase SacC (GH32 family)
VAAFFECPDVFPIGDKGQFVAITSLYNWKAGGYFVNSYFIGRIVANNFIVEARGPLDYGQYYAARTGSVDRQSASARRVIFSATVGDGKLSAHSGRGGAGSGERRDFQEGM